MQIFGMPFPRLFSAQEDYLLEEQRDSTVAEMKNIYPPCCGLCSAMEAGSIYNRWTMTMSGMPLNEIQQFRFIAASSDYNNIKKSSTTAAEEDEESKIGYTY